MREGRVTSSPGVWPARTYLFCINITCCKTICALTRQEENPADDDEWEAADHYFICEPATVGLMIFLWYRSQQEILTESKKN
jgi:hypothetical protein